MVTVSAVLVIAAFVCAVVSYSGKPTLGIGVVLLCVERLLQLFPR